ncbi:antA/AntB antirepressor family protein [Bartonella henselae]|uniref:Anti-repressor protein n=1 Tax=Bartonella henselae TaxID=38323 RepID=X5MEQ0_BARHN|nr:antA/AntB antirepressor family protein [Bartonella henselae]OLL41384.1 antirepressor [Bartonella henselae]OLL44629.1 antirepressor [Bartonella henselae]OLL54103.1 antirepressor [Bartonella henselae]UJM32751.1 antA/AntB antirepressor family protein [Bartonella henselae]UJM43003.1 antA/AntB antirepressor family protein [Bartonella henselae]
MNILIKISEKVIDQETVQTVNARELHAFLEVGRDFTTWIKNRIKAYKFVHTKDYILTFPKTGERQNVSMTEYYLTLDMAKELSMVERNEKGRQARRYFIECEKKLKSQSVEYDVDRRFDLPSHWEGMNAGEKALYLLGPIHVRLIDAFRVDEENRKYKALIKEAKQVLAGSVVKAA